MSTLNFRKLRSITHRENGSKNLLTEKGSQTREAFQKNIEKMLVQVQKYEQYLASKNDLKRPRGAF